MYSSGSYELSPPPLPPRACRCQCKCGADSSNTSWANTSRTSWANTSNTWANVSNTSLANTSRNSWANSSIRSYTGSYLDSIQTEVRHNISSFAHWNF